MNRDDIIKMAEWLEENDASIEVQNDAAAELRRLHALNAELLEALQRIAMAAGATVCNVEWVEKHARTAIAKAQEQK